MKKSIRDCAAAFGAALLITVVALRPANADVAMSGSFTATETCPAFQSFRKSTNPGDVKVEPNKTYALLSKNKDDATHYRIIIENAEPKERWVSISCGRVDQTAHAPTPAPGPNGGPVADDKTGARATHVLALGWEPAFCLKHEDKSECGDLKASSFDATHLSLHGLWPQPRGTQYCNVAPDLQHADNNHDWNALPEPDMSADTRKRLAAVMPGVQSNLQRHEWIVHGTCFGATADKYFTRAAGLAEAVNASKVAQVFADNAGRNLSADAIRSAFDEAFGTGVGARVTVSCNGHGDSRKITELIISLAGDVKGSAGLGDLMRAAQALPPGCPGGLIERAP